MPWTIAANVPGVSRSCAKGPNPSPFRKAPRTIAMKYEAGISRLMNCADGSMPETGVISPENIIDGVISPMKTMSRSAIGLGARLGEATRARKRVGESEGQRPSDQ